MPRAKDELLRQLELSIKAIKAGEFPKQKRDSLGERLRHLDGMDLPDALEVGPEHLKHDGGDWDAWE